MMRGTGGFEILDGCRRTIVENEAKKTEERKMRGFVGGGGDSWTEAGTGIVANHGEGLRLAGWRRCDGSV